MVPESRPDLMSIETPESVAFAYELAGAGSRGAALILDTVIVTLLIAAEAGAGVLVGMAFSALGLDVADVWIAGAVIAVAFITYWGYYIWGEAFRNGRTPGKRWLGLRVVRDDGSRVGVMDSAIRTALRLVDMLPGYYGVGLVAMLVSERSKRLGDMVAGTIVVRDSGDLALHFEGRSQTRRDALAAEYLARRASLTPGARYQVGCEVLATYGEEPGDWDEPSVAGRVADLAGLRADVDAPPQAV